MGMVALETLLDVHLGLKADLAGRAGDVERPAHRHPPVMLDDLNGGAWHKGRDDPRGLEDSARPSARDVEGPAGGARMQCRADDPPGGVAHIGEVEGVVAPPNLELLPQKRVLEKNAEHTPVVVRRAVHRRGAHDGPVDSEKAAEGAHEQLTRQLHGAVKLLRLLEVVLPDGGPHKIPVDHARGDIDEALKPGQIAGCLEERKRSHQDRLDGLLGMVDSQVGQGHRRQMNDALRPEIQHGAAQAVLVLRAAPIDPDLVLDQPKSRIYIIDMRSIERKDVVYEGVIDRDLVPLLEQLGRHVAPDESGAPGQEYAFHGCGKKLAADIPRPLQRCNASSKLKGGFAFESPLDFAAKLSGWVLPLFAMTAIIFCLHSVIVFLVPIFFGWAVLRRIAREHDLAILAPGSAVVGFAALMASVNELRCWLEAPAALWFAYKLLLLAGLSILVCTRRPDRAPMLARRLRDGWKLAGVAAGAVLTGIYFGIPAYHGFLDDAWWGHYPIAVEIQNAAHFPLFPPFAPDDPLYYHAGPDILASGFSSLLLLPVQEGFALAVALFAPLAFLLAFGLTLRLSRSYVSALLAAGFAVVGGNLRFIGVFGADLGNAASRLQVFNSQTIQGLLQMMFTPSHCLGIPLVLAILAVFRHFLARPSWPLAALLGLLLGSLTLVAEWYFYPLWLALGICVALRALRGRGLPPRIGRGRLVLLCAPLVVAVAVGLYNSTYTAGIFNYFWTHRESTSRQAFARQVYSYLDRRLSPPPSISPATFHWTVPTLIPLGLNFAHLGEVPSWELAGSNSGSWVALWSWAFIREAFPVVGIGIPFGIWWWRRSRNLLLLAVLLMAAISLAPPILLDWGYRSTDFLRFFTGAFSFSSLLLACFVGRMLEAVRWPARILGVSVIAATLTNAAGLGILGLQPSTLATAKAVSSEGISLSQFAGSGAGGASPEMAPADRSRAFSVLAARLDDFFFPISRGRERAIVIVPPNEVPPLERFPEWMKLATLSRLVIPVGWHWADSLYAAKYRNAVLTLDSDALSALGARWVIVTNLWGYAPPAAVARALREGDRFTLVTTFSEGPYTLALYRAQ